MYVLDLEIQLGVVEIKFTSISVLQDLTSLLLLSQMFALHLNLELANSGQTKIAVVMLSLIQSSRVDARTLNLCLGTTQLLHMKK